MPEMDGFALCAAVRSHTTLHQVPVVLLTALEDDASRTHGRLVGATAFLTKPVSKAALRAQVASLLPLREAPASGT